MLMNHRKVLNMLVLHHFDTHYSLIVPGNSWLALSGGLDHQRVQSKLKENEENNSGMNDVDKISIVRTTFVHFPLCPIITY